MSAPADIADGVVHAAPDDLRAALAAGPRVLALWQGLTPLGRNEFICWIKDARQAATRQRRIARALESLGEGKRRPCCWPGCSHRPGTARAGRGA